MIYKDAEKEGLPRHHFMRTFLTAVPLSAVTSSTLDEVMPPYVDWVKHTLNRKQHPRRLVKLKTKGLLTRIGKKSLYRLPTTALSAVIGGLLLDEYLHKKLKRD